MPPARNFSYRGSQDDSSSSSATNGPASTLATEVELVEIEPTGAGVAPNPLFHLATRQLRWRDARAAVPPESAPGE